MKDNVMWTLFNTVLALSAIFIYQSFGSGIVDATAIALGVGVVGEIANKTLTAFIYEE